MDFFTVPTATFRMLYVFFIVRHGRRQIAHFAVTAHPTADWVRQQLREYVAYFHEDRCHLSLDKDPPVTRPVTPKPSPSAKVIALPRIGGLHHRYAWRDAA